MKKLILLALLLCASLGWSQQQFTQSQNIVGSVGPTALPGLNEQTFQIGWHTIVWVASGTVSTCTVQAESSAAGVSFALYTGSVAQTCTSTGMYQFYGTPVNFFRMNVTALSGTGNVTFSYIGQVNTPVSIAPQIVYSTGSYTNATTGFTSVTGLAFNVAANQNIHAICRITWQGSAGTTGPKYQFTGPGSPTAVVAGLFSNVTVSTYVTVASAVAFSSAMANTGTVTSATNFTDTVDIAVLNGANAGTIQLQMAANGAGTLTVQNGSYCQYQ